MHSRLTIHPRASQNLDESYMFRCLELASLGRGHTAPNPMVGAVLVHGDRIIGEGWHQHFGKAHAEVNCIQSVNPADDSLIKESILYVSLEPCAHHGKTPPCTDLIIRKGIKKVVIGCLDPFVEVDGKGIEKLKTAGIDTVLGVLEAECKEMNKRFFAFHLEHRPYIILKWAQSADGRMAHADRSRVFISNAYTNRLVHKWRSEESSILVGTNTALFDDPMLTTRLWKGPDPIRLVIDMDLRLPGSLKIFDRTSSTIVFNAIRHAEESGLLFYQVTRDVSVVQQVVHALYQLKIQSVMVEGGAALLQSFIDEETWDEARVISNSSLSILHGIPSPSLGDIQPTHQEKISTDSIRFFKRS
jgi:diaminohydroxyphosphoribosylaminopyrimidine deaminase / 5-amino-6-(5-phosphoribosylamino)uracil reductase